MGNRFHAHKFLHALELREKTPNQQKTPKSIQPTMFLNFHLPENTYPGRTELYSPKELTTHSVNKEKVIWSA